MQTAMTVPACFENHIARVGGAASSLCTVAEMATGCGKTG